MTSSTSSNNLLADRRFGWAMALAAEDDLAAAADLLDQVVSLAPRWAPGWSALGDARDRLDQHDAALTAWRHADALDPEGRLGAALKIARLDGTAPDAMPAAYMRALFDDYAPRFDRHLVEGLHYRGPELLAAALSEVAPGRIFERALDLGCGTGLMGRALMGRAKEIDGLDLSPAMVAKARETDLYTTLSVASIEEGLGRTPDESYDLLTAADVLVYVGDLSSVMVEARRVLSLDGLFAFTVQADPHDMGFTLGPDLRFAHSRSYVEDRVVATGLGLEHIEAASTRIEKGVAVAGLLVIARRA